MPNDAVSRPQAACDAAYQKNPKSCSNAVWDVIRAMLNPDEPYRTANALVDHLDKNWTSVTLDQGYELANKGIVVVGGKKETGNGHVIVIYPGARKQSGGYAVATADGKTASQRSHGVYPLAMSTSLGAWPGAMSDGDKTVWDAWGRDLPFRQVRFWAPKNAQTDAALAAIAKGD